MNLNGLRYSCFKYNFFRSWVVKKKGFIFLPTNVFLSYHITKILVNVYMIQWTVRFVDQYTREGVPMYCREIKFRKFVLCIPTGFL